jgi:hypothetical protein
VCGGASASLVLAWSAPPAGRRRQRRLPILFFTALVALDFWKTASLSDDPP